MTRFSEPSLYRIKYNALDPSSLETSETNMKNGSSILSYKYFLQVCQRVCSKSLFLNESYADEYQMIRTPQTRWGSLKGLCIPKMSRQKGDIICNVNRRECYIPLMHLQTSPDPMRDVTITMTPGLAQTSGARVTLLLSDFTETGLQASPYSYLNSHINTSKTCGTFIAFISDHI